MTDTVHEKYFSKSILEDALSEQAKQERKRILAKDTNWLQHAIPYITSVTPDAKSYSLQSLYEKLFETKQVMVNGKVVSGEIIRLVYRVLGELDRSLILPSRVKQTDNTLYSAAVPWVLYAFKQHYNVPYSKWKFDSSERFHTMVLGKALKDYFLVKERLDTINDDVIALSNAAGEMGDSEYLDSIGKSNYPMKRYEFDEEDILKYRSHMLRLDSDAPLPDTNYVELQIPSSETKLAAILPKFYWCMLTQTWIFSPSIRNENMVTSLFHEIDYFEPAIAPINVKEVIEDLW